MFFQYFFINVAIHYLYYIKTSKHRLISASRNLPWFALLRPRCEIGNDFSHGNLSSVGKTPLKPFLNVATNRVTLFYTIGWSPSLVTASLPFLA